ncbi:sirohydrochlorin chelatase [Waterburya agarophytonicola K14]|uniref:Sirohydrochlorin chelatase n=1 Tax=Waterburya agarophytonicola KI4 TaxID=2874699 RepID=A0A964BSL1_9CYAN|nr:CbiX/SirB N-terminal domain-containing protein [Waterburya agarophytonicola]MCC0177437.1 sirohydrochlorin chelatase [Waterburya agarophytonicola KI4]
MSFPISLLQFIEISLTTSSAYFLVIHGSRNLKTQTAAAKLQHLTSLKIKSKDIITQQNYGKIIFSSFESKTVTKLDFSQTPLVGIAALELTSLSLNQSLVEFALKADSLGFSRVKVLPLFLAPGVHVREDIPEEIALAIKQIKNRVTIELSPFLGKYSGMVQLLSDKFLELSARSRILVAHGSRLPGVADYYENLAQKLNATTAYWSTDPSLAQQVKAQITAGHTKIAILPYFLFPGKIVRAIAVEVASLQADYPNVELILGQPLGATKALAELIAKEI